MDLYTIDPYTNVVQYNESLQALRNNEVDFRQFIELRAPYQWYLELPYAPLLVNYDKMDTKKIRYVVQKVRPVKPADEFQLLRREHNGINTLYIENQPLEEARKAKYAVFFQAASFDKMKEISKNLPGQKIYYFGKHLGSRFKIGLSTNKMILNFLQPDSILIEKDSKAGGFKKIGGSEGTQGNQGNDYSKPGFFEADLNYRIFKNKDFLNKFTETPYFLDGKYYPVKFQGTFDSPDKINRFTF